MKKIACLALSLAATLMGYSQNADSVLLKNVSDEIMLHGTCYENLRVLTKTIGHRLSGSPEADKAVEWGRKAMTAAGAENVWLQPVDVPVWRRGAESLKLQLDGKEFVTVSMLSLGNTDGTGGKMLEREVICVPDMDAFAALPAEKVKDKIIFFNYSFRQDIINTFEGYGDAVKYRWMAVNKAADRGAAAVIIRSVSTGADDAPHTGTSHYTDTTRHIPAVAIGNTSATKLAAACSNHTVKAQLISDCGMNGTKRSYNVIGEIKGTEEPNEIIVVGGHLDSWDVGEGAQDDGAGCVQSIEVLRSIKALGIRPKHTIRAVLFMNEENGTKGGNAYADSSKKANEQPIFAMESDAGGFTPRGVGLEMPLEPKQKIRRWAPLFMPYGVYDFMQEESGTDIGPMRKLNVPLAGLLPDSQRYFDLHHSRNDVFEAVSHRELKLGAWTMAAMVLLVDKYF
ncbi:M20/M25/M40 family metallo-hydrolase [Taibaiella lutea]|uniref:Carboxypeptidase Q n=1 Tax=Taibaiella lutea TaxID=2608001 RepID=A0A5M6CSG3_9BACT|nr:M20/M25/M40 family metallo-hydrolase [Taibaiella lutea]KAA5536892.1 M20/M25/M40 family metallo-hydrolase [Taibaiella lutea]